MARICIITPGQLGSNPRVVKAAEALTDAGHSVTVIATKVMDLVEPRDLAILAEASFEVRRVRLDSKARRLPGHLLQIGARKLYRKAPFLRLAAFAHRSMVLPIMRAALSVQADLYIAHYVAALPAAATAASRYNACFGFDAEDYHLGDLPDLPEHALEHELIKAIEGALLPRAAHITAASPGIAEALVNTYRVARPTVVLNTFPKREAPPCATSYGRAVPSPSLYWFSQVVGPNRGLECALEAIARTKARAHLFLRGGVANGYDQTLKQLASEFGVVDRLHFLPAITPKELVKAASDYDLGLCVEPGHTPNNNLALSNKLFTFLLAGLPPLLSNTPAQARFAKDAGLDPLLFPIGNAAALATMIDSIILEPGRLKQLRSETWALAQSRFNWDQESSVLIDLVQNQLAGNPTPKRGQRV